MFQQSSDGKLVYIGMGHAGAYKIESYKFNAPTSNAGATPDQGDPELAGGSVDRHPADESKDRILNRFCHGEITLCDGWRLREIGVCL